MNILTALGTVVVVLVAYLATTPTSADRQAGRRARLVSRRPALANLGDVQARLADELPGDLAAYVMRRVSGSRIDAQTLWAWLERFDASDLVLALAIGHGQAGLLRILRNETRYDAAEARLLASVSAPEVAGSADPGAVGSASTSVPR